MKNIKNKLPILLVLMVLVLSSIACSIGGLTFNRDSATIDIKLKEDQINLLFERIGRTSVYYAEGDLLDKLDRIELHDGYIRLFGSHTPEGGSTLSGSFDVSIGAQNDILQAQITAVDIPGLDLNDPRIQQANQVISKELTEMITESNGEVLFKKAEVQEDALHLRVQVIYQNTP